MPTLSWYTTRELSGENVKDPTCASSNLSRPPAVGTLCNSLPPLSANNVHNPSGEIVGADGVIGASAKTVALS
jgi:hypothetical protein